MLMALYFVIALACEFAPCLPAAPARSPQH